MQRHSHILTVWAAALIVVSASASQPLQSFVRSQTELIAAIANQTIGHIRLESNIRLTADAWPNTSVLYVVRNLTIAGSGSSTTLIDFSFLSAKVTLAPGVTLRLQSLESRNGRSAVGYGIDFLTASPGATLEFVNSTMFQFACLPLELLMPVLRSYGRAGAPQPVDSPQDHRLDVALEATWCRTTPAIARCYNNCVSVASVVLPVALYTGSSSGSQAGGYTVAAYNSTVVCESPVSTACGVQMGYEACILARRQQLYEADATWDLLEAASAAAAGGGGGGGTGGLGGGRLAGAVVGGVAGAGLLAGLVAGAAIRWRQRRRKEAQYAAAGAPPPPVPPAAAPQADEYRVGAGVGGGGGGGRGGGGGIGSGGGGNGAAARYVAAAAPRPNAAAAAAAGAAAGGAGPSERPAGTRQTGVSSGTAQECVRTFGEPYSQQCTDQFGEQVAEGYAEPYGDPVGIQNVRAWLAEQHTTLPPPPPAEQDQSVWQSA